MAIALIPSLALLGIGVGAAGYLLYRGEHYKSFISIVEGSNKTTRDLVSAIEKERMLGLWQLAGQPPDPGMAAARSELDNALDEMKTSVSALAASDVGNLPDLSGFDAIRHELPVLRSRIDSGGITVSDAYEVYTKMLDGLIAGTLHGARNVSTSSAATFDLYGALRITRATEAMSRSSALTAAALNVAGLPGQLNTEYRQLVGYYRTEVGQLSTDLGGAEADRAKAITASPEWHTLDEMENYILQGQNVTRSSRTAMSPPVALGEWRNAVDQVTHQLLQLWQMQNDVADRADYRTADRSTHNSLLTGAGITAITIIGFVLSLVLANRLIGRLERLRTQTLALAEEQLPETMRKLAEGEHVDPESSVVALDFGTDEIGSVANAFNRAHTAAVSAAVDEARTREGVRAVFLNIAHRSQIIVHRQLEILDEAERQQEDPALLDTLFKLDHLATRERRNAENLIILGGGEPGRKWRRPVALLELVRSAVGETLDYARIHAGRMPDDVFVIGTAVADLVHLLAELADNAVTYSPPHSRVEVSGSVAAKGVVVEISDQGVGMTPQDLERANEMLSEPPDYGVATLSAHSRLGLFVVAQLAHRQGISARLAESFYGGVRAIVLIPSSLITTHPAAVDHLPQRLTDRHVDQSPTGRYTAVRTTAISVAPPAEQVEARPALPKRRKRASLAPELADGPTTVSAGPSRPRNAEQARDLMAAIEAGTRQGRSPHPGGRYGSGYDQL